MAILADTREQAPYGFNGYAALPRRATIPAGDYSLPGFGDHVAIERKELGGLVACLMGSNRGRFERELAKLRFYDLAAVVVEASMQDVSEGANRSNMKSHAVLQSFCAFQVR